MKYELETIPVWDAIKDDNECFLCTLMKQSEQVAVSYYLGSSVMHVSPIGSSAESCIDYPYLFGTNKKRT